jgi:hypothetical protein
LPKILPAVNTPWHASASHSSSPGKKTNTTQGYQLRINWRFAAKQIIWLLPGHVWSKPPLQPGIIRGNPWAHVDSGTRFHKIEHTNRILHEYSFVCLSESSSSSSSSSWPVYYYPVTHSLSTETWTDFRESWKPADLRAPTSKRPLIQEVIWRDWGKPGSLWMRKNIFQVSQNHRHPDGVYVTVHTAKDDKEWEWKAEKIRKERNTDWRVKKKKIKKNGKKDKDRKRR